MTENIPDAEGNIDHKKALERLGLSSGEINAYFSVAGKGVCLMSEIAKHARVEIGEAKSIVSKKKKKGLLKEIPGRTAYHRSEGYRRFLSPGKGRNRLRSRSLRKRQDGYSAPAGQMGRRRDGCLRGMRRTGKRNDGCSSGVPRTGGSQERKTSYSKDRAGGQYQQHACGRPGSQRIYRNNNRRVLQGHGLLGGSHGGFNQEVG